MKIRTVDQFLDKVSDERIWRIREISTLRLQCYTPDMPEHAAKALRRSFVPIAYAHWEGFVKKVAHYYLELVAMQGLQLGELNSSFMSLYLWKEYGPSISRGKAFSLVDICNTMMTQDTKKVRIHYKDVISTNSNLDSKTLSDICSTLGLSFTAFETKTLFIDATLVGKRNHIAHGEDQEILKFDMENIKKEVVNLIDIFRNEIENAATSSAFKRLPHVA
jgi:hypothetical protein